MTYGEWRPRPWWMFWSRAQYVRSVYAPAMLGGGWDGWEYLATTADLGREQPRG